MSDVPYGCGYLRKRNPDCFFLIGYTQYCVRANNAAATSTLEVSFSAIGHISKVKKSLAASNQNRCYLRGQRASMHGSPTEILLRGAGWRTDRPVSPCYPSLKR